METLSLTDLLQALNATGVSAILLVFVWMFLKGEIVSRRTHDEIVEKVVSEVTTHIIEGVGIMFRDWEESRLSIKVEQLEQQKEQLIRELGADDAIRGSDD